MNHRTDTQLVAGLREATARKQAARALFDSRVRKLHAEGLTMAAISTRTGKTAGAVGQAYRRMGLKGNGRSVWSDL